MTYRDDHDAALARADALEKELADARTEHQRDEQRIAALEAKLRDRDRPKPRRRPAPKPAGQRRVARWVLLAGVVSALVLAVAIVSAVLVNRHRADQAKVAAGWDVQQYLGQAITDAKQQWSDAELMKITADFVDSAGRAQLTQPSARLSYWFRSPSRSTPLPAPARIGLPAPQRTKPCQLRERIYRQDTTLSSDTYSDSDPTCGASLPEPLRCTIVQIWQKAIAKGAPRSALAAIWLRTEGSPPKRSWRFEIEDATHVHDFRASFDDDCQ